MATEELFPDLIGTKLHRPLLTRKVVIRPRLLEQLDRGLLVPITLVCAPAGFGKTTLVNSWLEGLSTVGTGAGEPVRAAWLSLDEGDNHIFVFLRYLVTAVRAAFPDALPHVLNLLRAPEQPTATMVAVALINGLIELPSRFVLVLEDYHAISSEAVHGLLQELSYHWPPGCHLILTSRTSPPLALAKLRALGQVNEIRGHDLRFSGEESAAFLAEALTVPLSPSSLALLQQRTEGWAAGLQLASLTLAMADDAESAAFKLGGTDANIADYLAGEVLTQQLPAIQEFLLKTSLLGRLCAPLCTAVLEDDENHYDSRACLDWLERANLFVIQLDQTKEWYRYHALFQEFLQQRLRTQLDPEQVAALYRRAARWFAQHGLMEEALRNALAAWDHDLAATLMEEALPIVLNHEDRVTLERWLQLLPEEFVEGRPGLLMIKAWALQFSWQLEMQASVVKEVEALLADDHSLSLSSDALQVVRAQLAVLHAQAANFSNQPNLAVAICQEALSSLPLSWKFVRGTAAVHLGLALQASGQSDKAEQILTDAYKSITDKYTTYAARHLVALCSIHWLNGKLDRLIQTAQSMLTLAEAAGLSIHKGWAWYYLAVGRYEQNDLVAARQHFEKVVANSYVFQAMTVRASFFGLVLSQQALDNVAEAWQTIYLFSKSDLLSRGAEDERTGSLTARLHLLSGSMERASRWEHSSPAPVRDEPLYWLEEPPITKVRILLARNAEGDMEAAVDLLDSLDEVARRTFNVTARIVILSLRALALSMRSIYRRDETLAVLQQAVDLAEPGGFIRPFVELGPQMRDLLQQLAAKGDASAYLRSLLGAFNGSDVTAQSHSKNVHAQADSELLIEHLTPREMEVLALLRRGLSDKEIAHQLAISLKTVKRHTSNLFGKLGVNRRWDAVAKAESFGLLPHT